MRTRETVLVGSVWSGSQDQRQEGAEVLDSRGRVVHRIACRPVSSTWNPVAEGMAWAEAQGYDVTVDY